MKKMAESMRVYEAKRRVAVFLLGLATGFILTLIGLGLKAYFSMRDDEIVEHYGKCISYQNTIKKLQPEVMAGNPQATEEFGKLLYQFEEEKCHQFYQPY